MLLRGDKVRDTEREQRCGGKGVAVRPAGGYPVLTVSNAERHKISPLNQQRSLQRPLQACEYDWASGGVKE
ncbi:hypothetical protein SKAU_G00041490 [Synaphobranchus kaupii]|uniref:Uncharacterized protein n=1 Tax=Synaphobranchus kaupii TaxID=118154 RepID=A0A9Q1G276_SYNKA|nr:hypothetical protein SKAU_G00041490 [Synaphobranchus kaupii]